MMRLKSRPVLAFTLACSVATATLAQAGPSAEAQKAAIRACKASLGIGGATRTTTRWESAGLGGGMTIVLVKPHGEVTPEYAAQINDCAARSLMSGSTPAEPAMPDADVYVVAEEPGYIAPARSFGCVMGMGVMQRGTLICPGH